MRLLTPHRRHQISYLLHHFVYQVKYPCT